MDQLPEKQKQTQLSPVGKILQESTVQALAAKDFEAYAHGMPAVIEKALNLPVLREMCLAVGDKLVCGYIEFELIKLAERVNVSGNLTTMQIEFIAAGLMVKYPNETLADFKICFERMALGQYGKIWKLDGVEIGVAMEKYLEEKYEVKVREMYKERDQLYQRIKNTEPEVANQDKHQEWLDKLKEAVAGIEAKKVPSLPDEMINEIGRKDYKRPSATRGYAWFDVGGVMIYATSQEHAEELVTLHIKNGDIEEV
jgi:hypothetical protein